MAQLVRMDARLDTLSDELCQVNTRVSRITRRQAVMGGFIVASSPSPSAQLLRMRVTMAPTVMTLMRMMMLARLVMMRCLLDVLTPLSLVTKKVSSFEMRVVILIGGGLV